MRRSATGFRIRRAEPDDHPALVDLWLRSVRATHTFLTDDDIESMLPIVRDSALDGLELWVMCGSDPEPMGFMGLSGASVEALFIPPEWLRLGGGRTLIEHARRLKGRLSVEVNEQNAEAVRFYRACRFAVMGRSELDRDGRRFPLLLMEEQPDAGH